MVEYEKNGKIVRGPFIKSESNAVKLFYMMELGGVIEAIFKYAHTSSIAKGNLIIKPREYSYSIEFYGDNPFDTTHIPEIFKTIEIEIEPASILDKKEKFNLSKRGYKFEGFEYHQVPHKTGIHILSDKDKKETIAGMSVNAENYNALNEFKLAMTKLGFDNLKDEIKRSEIIKLF